MAARRTYATTNDAGHRLPDHTKPYPPLINELRSGLVETGYYEGQNVSIEYTWAEGHYDRLPALAAELVRRRVDVIVAAGGTNAGMAAKAATGTIPIVVLIGGDPVELGFAASFSHPGGNVTGVAQLVVAAEQKRLELLHELVPTAKTIAYLMNPAGANAQRQVQDAVSQEHALGVKLSVLRASSERDFAAAFASIVQDRIGALRHQAYRRVPSTRRLHRQSSQGREARRYAHHPTIRKN